MNRDAYLASHNRLAVAAAVTAMLSAMPVMAAISPQHGRRSIGGAKSWARRNRGTGAGFDRAIEREEREAAFRTRLYAATPSR